MKHNEQQIELNCIEWFRQIGWDYLPAENLVRESLERVVLTDILREKVAKFNPQLPASAVDEVVKTVCQFERGELLERNQKFHQFLRQGVRVKYLANGQEKFVNARLVDFDDSDNNHFLVVNQFKLKGTKSHRIPDLVCFLNGLPIAVLELKNPFKANITLQDAYNQLQTYKEEISELFVFNEALVISNGWLARVGSLSANLERFMPWRNLHQKAEDAVEWELETMVRSFFHPTLLLDYLQYFVIFEEDNGKLIKKIAAYHQFDAVREAVRCTLTASGMSESGYKRSDFGANLQVGSKKAGVVWHTQGSGKSLSMLCYVAKLVAQPAMKNPTIVMVTDRNDLDGQLFQTFSKGYALIGQKPTQAESREDLRQRLAEREAGGIIFTTIQKFGLASEEETARLLNDRHNIVVVADEAHRSQYGLNKHYDTQTGNSKYGYARYMRDALPNASFIGFTGTPISLEDKDTRAVFGDYVSIYDIHNAVEDGATVPIYYEPRLIKLAMSEQAEELLAEMDDLIEDDDDESERTKAKIMRMENVLGTEQRIDAIAKDILQHFDERSQLMDGKAMVVALSRKLCVKLFDAIVALRPEWDRLEASEGAIKIVMTANANDPEHWQRHNYSPADKKLIEKRFKDPADPLKMVIVRDMWLTGFDVPCLHTMYIDKPMQGHNLMQAIARVNRVYPTKSKENGGLIVSYLPLDKQLKEAMDTYTASNGRGEIVTDVEQVLAILQDKVSQLEQILDMPIIDEPKNSAQNTPHYKRCDWRDFLQNPLNAMKNASEHLLALARQDEIRIQNEQNYAKANGRKPRKARNIKLKFADFALSALRAYMLISSLEEAKALQEKVAFFNAVKALTAQQARKANPLKPEQEREQLEKLLNNTVIPNGIANIFSLTGINSQKVEVSLLSAQFLDDLQGTPYPHLATSALEKLLKDEIKSRLSLNQVKQKDFKTRLDQVLERYNTSIDSVQEIIRELIALAEELKQSIARGQELGLTETELAFYDALCTNQTAEQLLGEKVLVDLAKELIHLLKREATIDWTFRESVQAKMRLMIKRLLKKYKYPPDNDDKTVDLVLKQAELTIENE